MVFSKTTACSSYVQPWLVAIGGWRLVEIAGWRLAVGGWWLAVVGGSWQLVMGGWWRLAAVDSWRLVAVGVWRLVAVGGWWQLAVSGWWSLGVVLKGGPLKKKEIWSLKDRPAGKGTRGMKMLSAHVENARTAHCTTRVSFS